MSDVSQNQKKVYARSNQAEKLGISLENLQQWFTYYVLPGTTKELCKCKKCNNYDDKTRPKAPQLLTHLQKHYSNEQIKRGYDMNQGQQALTKEQIFAINEAQKIRDIANLLVDKGLPFKLVDSKLFRRLTGIITTRHAIKNYIVERGQEIEQTQFNIYPIIDYELARTAAVLMLDAWQDKQGRKMVCYLLRTELKVHFVGLRTTDESQHSLWLAKQTSDIIKEIENTNRIRVCGTIMDNASTNKASFRLLMGETVPRFANHDKTELDDIKLRGSYHQLVLDGVCSVVQSS
ncbi:Conserved_hypothetical protein [Hexamita inflata]|uniref:Uncharacterized protein n=1 Tax=Hexamita inflata TaxID=28002 RepID=A0AA86VRV0_9EUKA|nr:Conserved hypothetical protein [Hexamita inflata]